MLTPQTRVHAPGNIDPNRDDWKGTIHEHYEQAGDAAPTVTLYTTPGCPGCQMTHRALEKAGLEFITIDLSTRPDLIEQFKREGLMSAPILEDEAGERTSGFRPDRIRALIAANTGKTTHASTARNASTAGTASTTGSAPPRPHGRSTFEAEGPRP